ncbi:MAG: hypothetical protein QMC89_01925 [Candidatus Hodarchaeaceae archaeon]|nr:hypothetical protein [Candidatus Hodarchaeaceae archaeon]
MRVLFVCVENACWSQMAEAFFNKMSRAAKASNAGTKPAMVVNPIAVEVMKEVGVDMSDARSKLLTLEMLEEADKVITMGCSVGRSAPGPPLRPRIGRRGPSWEIDRKIPRS